MSACSSTAGADELGLWELSEEPTLVPHATMHSPVKSVSSAKEKMEKMETSAGKLSGLLDTCGFGDGAARASQGIRAQRNKGNFKRHKQASRIFLLAIQLKTPENQIRIQPVPLPGIAAAIDSGC